MANTEEMDASITSFEESLKLQSGQLKSLVDDGDVDGALDLIAEINKSCDRRLYLEVGLLTRSLHESIRNFQIDTANADTEDVSKIEDATDRLSYVVEKTNTAANKTLDLVEEMMPCAADIQSEAKELKTEWGRLRDKEITAQQFRELTVRMDTFLERLTSDADKVNENLQAILLAQDFQDLTGQVINRVTTLVKDVEENLVNLVRMAGTVDALTGTVHDIETADNSIKGEGPQIKADQRDDVVSSQDDVDDLLSSLGF